MHRRTRLFPRHLFGNQRLADPGSPLFPIHNLSEPHDSGLTSEGGPPVSPGSLEEPSKELPTHSQARSAAYSSRARPAGGEWRVPGDDEVACAPGPVDHVAADVAAQAFAAGGFGGDWAGSEGGLDID